MAGYLLADSFGGLQQAENAQDSNRRMALAAAMGNAMQGLQSMRAAKINQAQRDQEQANWERQFGLQRDSASLARQRFANEDWRQIQANDIANKYVGLQERMLKLQESGQNAAGVRAQEDQERYLMGDAQTGFQSLQPGQSVSDHIATFYPHVSAGVAKAAESAAMLAWQQQQDAYDKANSAADTLNNYDDLNARVEAAKKKVATYGLIGRNVTDKAAYQAAQQELDHLTASQQTMSQFVPRLQQRIKNPKDPLSALISEPINAGDPWSVSVRPPRRNPYAPQPGDAEAAFGPGPEPAVDTSGDVVGEMTPVPRQAAPSVDRVVPRRKYSPFVYDRTNYWMSQGMNPVMAVQKSLLEEQAMQ